MLVLLAGLPGAGKSTLAAALADRLGGLVLDKDRVRDAIFPPAEVDYSDRQNALATEVVLMVAGYILGRDPDKLVILDGKPYSRQADRAAAAALAARAGSLLRMIHCVAPDAVIRERLDAELVRDPQTIAADRTFAKALRIKAAFEPIVGPHLEVDTSRPLAEAVAACAAYLGREGAGA